MNVVHLHRLVDAPLSLDVAREERIDKIAEMAGVLIEKGCFSSHGDSIMVLVAAGYPPFEIFSLIDDVRQVAEQHVVAMEMSRP